MIEQGKTQGWLSLPIDSLKDWSRLNQVSFRSTEVGSFPNAAEKGSGIKVLAAELGAEDNPLMIVPADLILSRENIDLFSKSDKHLREVLDSVGDFGKTTRGAILIFMLIQATRNCPNVPEKVGVSCPFTEYIKYLPLELLPTSWTDDELDLLRGTSLAAAMETKMKSLFREFEKLRDSTAHINWCRQYWWDEVDGILTFDDWKQVDAMYRSRALEFPGIGDAMVPCVDMANHASGDATSALYEADEQGNGLLLLRDGQIMKHGEEVTITYGDEKGACEMLFSYGFIEDSMLSARDILLELDIPEDDPLKRAKKAVSTCAPGVRLIERNHKLQWESDYVWIMCVNEEDGLEFKLLQSTDGSRELVASWKDQDLNESAQLVTCLQQSPLWDVFQLRAVSLIQDRVEQQLRVIIDTEHELNKDETRKKNVRAGPAALASKLKTLECDLLERFYEYLEDEKTQLAKSDIVCQFLSNFADNDAEDDFS